MPSRPRLAPLALLALLLGPACGGDDEAAAVQDYLAAVDGYTRGICACEYNNPVYLVALGKFIYASSEACLMDLPLNAAERGCVDGMFSDESVDYSAVLDCRAATLERSSSCLRDKTCTDTARHACYKTLGDELKACPDLPDAVEARLVDCLYN